MFAPVGAIACASIAVSSLPNAHSSSAYCDRGISNFPNDSSDCEISFGTIVDEITWITVRYEPYKLRHEFWILILYIGPFNASQSYNS